MNVAAFVRAGEPSWRELEQLVSRAGARPERLGADGVRRLGGLYRAAAADLAYARRRFPEDPVTSRLTTLVIRARAAVYAGSGSERGGFLEIFGRGYWRRLHERGRELALAVALLVGFGALGALWGLTDPSAAIGVVPEMFRGAVSPDVSGGGLSTGDAAAFSTEVFTNNVGVTLLAFAAGILAGIGTVVIVAYNGLILGAVIGIAVDAGNGAAITQFVFAHGVLELSCIAAGAAAGLAMGRAMIRPGGRTRTAALAAEAREAVLIVIGTVPWLLVAGLVEGLVSRREVSTGAAVLIGLTLGGIYWGLILLAGRPATAQSRARSFART
ncbi:MAG: stage II sporulation protein M [Solirubrobacterales bacterium]|nr:stage II sporulation protein M [Solirubrobacterales bacterium]MCB8970245.1 stage II sporulation protein M [Thermoleophilales bacterium]MCO5327851.1 stage II sporulation protein M [Solirubrobacterales bacterium]